MTMAARHYVRGAGPPATALRGRSVRALCRAFGTLALVAAGLVGQAGVAAGDQTVDLRTDIARLLKLPEPAGTIVIGNPAIADATLTNASTLVLTGRSSGLTNMIILDREGDMLANVSIRVIRQGPRTVNVIRPGADNSRFFCADVCEPVTGGGGGGVGGQPVASPDGLEGGSDPSTEPQQHPEPEPPDDPGAGGDAEIAANR